MSERHNPTPPVPKKRELRSVGTNGCVCAHTHRASARNSPTLRPLQSSQQTFGEMPFSVDFRVYLQIRRKSGEMATTIKITQYARSGKVKPHFEVSETMRQRGLSRTHTQNNPCSLPLQPGREWRGRRGADLQLWPLHKYEVSLKAQSRLQGTPHFDGEK